MRVAYRDFDSRALVCYVDGVKHALIALFLLVLAACPRQTRKTLVPDVPQHGDSQARSRFLEAKSRFLRDGGMARDFQRIAEEFPQDPIVPWAELYAGIAAVKARSFAEADAQLTRVVETNANPGITARAELFLGITKNYLGDATTARSLLSKSERAVENDDERTEYLAAVAYSTASSDRPLGALPVFDQLFSRVTPTERALIVARCQELVAALDRNTLERLFDQIPDRRGPAIAAVGSRLVIIYDAAGDGSRAEKMRDNMVPVRSAVGLPRTITESEVGSVTASSGGDSGLAFFYEPKELKAGSKREYVYTYGRGIGSPISAEGQFQVNFSGSFEVGKTFTISALIADPAPGQALELDLPKGLERVEGKHVQPVPESVGESGYSMVVWKGRVQEYGRFPIRIKSSTGVIQTKVLTLSPG